MSPTTTARAPEVGDTLRYRGQDHTIGRVQPWHNQDTGEQAADKVSAGRVQGYERIPVEARGGGQKDGPYRKDEDGLPIPIPGVEYAAQIRGARPDGEGFMLHEVTRSDLSGLKILADDLVWCDGDYPRHVRRAAMGAARALTQGLGTEDREALEGFIGDLAEMVKARAPSGAFWVVAGQILPHINVPLAVEWLKAGNSLEVPDHG